MKDQAEKTLQTRLQTNPQKGFDQKFWNKFEQLKPKKEKSFSFAFFAPVVSAMLLIIFIMNYSQLEKTNQVLSQTDEEAKILADLDQQDWEILLGPDFDS